MHIKCIRFHRKLVDLTTENEQGFREKKGNTKGLFGDPVGIRVF